MLIPRVDHPINEQNITCVPTNEHIHDIYNNSLSRLLLQMSLHCPVGGALDTTSALGSFLYLSTWSVDTTVKGYLQR